MRGFSATSKHRSFHQQSSLCTTPLPFVIMTTLPVDIHLMISEYITTCEDLKTLCLTSKEHNASAIPKLYKRIHIRLWVREELDRFVASMTAGAHENFRYTRTLIIEDVRLPAEPHVPSAVAWISEDDSMEQCTPEERDDCLYSLIKHLPDGALRRFSFVSTRPIPEQAAKHLAEHQTSISDYQWNETQEHLQLPSISSGRALSLRITVDDGQTWPDLEIASGNARPKSMVKELRLLHVSAWNLFRPLSSLYNLSQLTHLSLLGSYGTAFLEAFEEAFVRGQIDVQLPLQHIAVEYQDSEQVDILEYDASLVRIYRACKTVKSLHVWWESNVPEERPERILKLLKNSAGALELLSLSHWGRSETLRHEEFDEICNACPGVRQLAIEIAENVLGPIIEGGCYRDFLASIKKLRELRFIHLRLPYSHHIGKDEHGQWSLDILVAQMKQFANRLFGELHVAGCCPLLEGLVIGHMVEVRPGIGSWSVPIPQCCFIREMENNGKDWRVSVAVPVSRAMLRKSLPYTNILDLDMAMDCVEPWHCWAGHAIA
ncbi:hypothetical protein HBH53_200080 [Parastagonospora nodorum]|nr:hypothetical protein HBH53_200080 [Parastagonospora nodorum]KAH4010267.1 hypothetical protein HBI13_211590 [Parastagonospora nodorum]KAH4016405.1 hypothetical protein HBI09_202740 [Parastagonospora nodorum]KAH4050043.1 hypothetical protein HBH49_141300 [Parastagonospora nodorum]KAH4091697.1 hypothetical protein HBH46_186440 [Parastagonospora nodorum]